MISFLCPLIYFILANCLLVSISKKSFGKCLPITFMINAFIYFLSQACFHTFKVGFYLNLLIPVMAIGLILYQIKNNKEELKKNIFSPGFYVFIILYVMIYFFNYNRAFLNWDEFSHWGVMIQEMLRLDKFYSHELSTLMVHKDYPPIMQMFELFYTQISGGYAENHLIRSVQLFNYSLFIPFICETNKNSKIMNIIRTILIIGTIHLLVLSFDQSYIINTIYIDYTMSILVAYLLITVFLEEDLLDKFHLFNLSIGFSFLLLLKQMGLPLYAMILFLYCGILVLKNKDKLKEIFKKENLLKTLKVFLIIVIIPSLFWKGWDYYASTLNVPAQFQLTDLKPTQLVSIVRGRSGEWWQKDASKYYIDAVATKNISNTQIELSYIQCIVLFFLLAYGIWIYGKKELEKKNIPLFATTVFLGFLGYAFVMLVMYTFSFGEIEGPTLASFDRYMPTYALIAFSSILMLFFFIDNKKNKSILSLCILFSVLFLIQNPKNLDRIVPQLVKERNIYKEQGELIASKTEEYSKVFVIAQDTLGQYQFPLKLYAGARTTNTDAYSWETEEIGDYQEYFNKTYKQELSNYDYLYLAKITDDFKENYEFLFDQEIKEQDIYKIVIENKQIKLKKV